MRSLILAGLTSVMLLPLAAQAQDKSASTAFNAGVASDYVFRGVSQTDEDPQLFGGLDLTAGMIYAGVWASNVDFNNGTDLEYDLYAGIKPRVGPATLDIGVIYYGYADSPSGPEQAYVEFKAAASVPAGPVSLGAAVLYSPEFFGETGKATYYEINAAFAVPDTKLSLSAAIGHQTVVGPLDYNTWNVGAAYALNEHFAIDLRYWDTSEPAFGAIYDSRVVIGLKAAF